MAEIDKKIASGLWNGMEVVIDRFYPHLVRHAQVDFLGHADVTIDASKTLPGLTLSLRGIQVKLLKGDARIDMKEEKGLDGKFYPSYFPRTAELRAVLTTRVFKHEAVLAAITAIQALPKPGATAPATQDAAGDNPFAS